MHFTKSSRWSLLLIAFVGLCWIGPFEGNMSTAGANRGESASRDELIDPNAAKKRREGSHISQLSGSFRLAGRRWTFVAESEDLAFVVLENLSLERAAKAIDEDPEDRHWKVSGKLTEYLDENYLLLDRIERAVKSTNE